MTKKLCFISCKILMSGHKRSGHGEASLSTIWSFFTLVVHYFFDVAIHSVRLRWSVLHDKMANICGWNLPMYFLKRKSLYRIIQILLKFAPKGPINNKAVLVQRRALTHLYIVRPLNKLFTPTKQYVHCISCPHLRAMSVSHRENWPWISIVDPLLFSTCRRNTRIWHES